MDFTSLDPVFARKAADLVRNCGRRGVEVRPYCLIKTPLQQAAQWRGGRTAEEIARAVRILRESGAEHLAACIEAVGPQFTARLTGGAPGLDWHQYGLAMDSMLVFDGVAVWAPEDPGWATYAAEAEYLGLNPGRNWGNNPHVQMPMREPSAWGYAKCNAMMLDRFPEIRDLVEA